MENVCSQKKARIEPNQHKLLHLVKTNKTSDSNCLFFQGIPTQEGRTDIQLRLRMDSQQKEKKPLSFPGKWTWTLKSVRREKFTSKIKSKYSFRARIKPEFYFRLAEQISIERY